MYEVFAVLSSKLELGKLCILTNINNGHLIISITGKRHKLFNTCTFTGFILVWLIFADSWPQTHDSHRKVYLWLFVKNSVMRQTSFTETMQFSLNWVPRKKRIIFPTDPDQKLNYKRGKRETIFFYERKSEAFSNITRNSNWEKTFIWIVYKQNINFVN